MTCSVPKHSQRFEPCLGLKVLFVPKLAKAHPDPKLSRVRVSEQQQHPEGPRELSKALHRGLGSAFCSSSGGVNARPGPAGDAQQQQQLCRPRQPALRCPGPGEAPRGGGSGREGAGPGIHEGVRSASCLVHSAFLIKISLRMIHTGESVWMDSLMASSGPKDGSTSPSATPLENEPIWT